jgi:hypothetical protein
MSRGVLKIPRLVLLEPPPDGDKNNNEISATRTHYDLPN